MSVVPAPTSFDKAITGPIKPNLSQASNQGFVEEKRDSSIDFNENLGSFDPNTFVNNSDTSESHVSRGRIWKDSGNLLEGFSLSTSPNFTDSMHPQSNGCNQGSLELQKTLSEDAIQSNQSEFNFLDFVDLSHRGSPSSQTPNPTDFELQHILDECHAFNAGGIDSSPICGGTTQSLVHADEHRLYSPEPVMCTEPVTQNGISLCDPSAIVAPLDFMNSHLLDSLNYPLLEWYTFNGPTLRDFFALLHSEDLSLGVEELLCEAMEARAKAIRHRQAAKQGWGGSITSEANVNESMLSKAETAPRGKNVSGKKSRQTSRTRTSSYLLSVTSRGALRIEYIPRINDIHHGAQGPDEVLKIFSLPQTRQRSTGVLVTFTQYKEISPLPYLSPYIETFNVVHQDSEIIQKVSNGDIQGVRRLFDAKLASPLDVDPHGFSLLSVG